MSVHQPVPVDGHFAKEAAVLVPIIETVDSRLELILTVRSERLNLHAGEISFPGGKVEPQDVDLTATAVRETEEETGIGSDNVTILGALSPVISKSGIHVTPFVGMVDVDTGWVHSNDEIDEIFTVPLNFFIENPPGFTELKHRHSGLRIPEYQYQGYRIWGLTAMIIVDFINVVFECGHDLRFQEHMRDVVVQQLVGRISFSGKDN